MTTFELNQYAGCTKYKVVTLLLRVLFTNCYAIICLTCQHAIGAHTELGQRALAMDGMIATICDTLKCSDNESTLGIITPLRGDQATISQLEEDLEAEKILTIQLKENVTQLETKLLKQNCKLDDV